MTDTPSATAAPTTPVAVTGWHVLIVLVVMGALVGIVAIVVNAFSANAGDAATIFGTIIPGIAAIGAAAFGIPLAYQTGKAGKDDAVTDATQRGKTEGKKVTARRIQQTLPTTSQLAAMGAGAQSASMSQLQAELITILSED